MATNTNVAWNFTVPDTSLMVTYNNFNRNCPNNKGVLDCSSTSSHVSNDTQSSFSLRFVGTSIFLFGTVDGGTQYTVQLDDGAATPGNVQGNDLLASFTNLPNTSDSDGDPHQVIVTATRFKENSILQFNGAVVSVDTGSTQAKPTIQQYILTDQNDSVKLTPGWTKNGTYMQSGVSFAQQATINFKGSAVMVYGLCSNTREDFGSEYGRTETDVDSFTNDVYDSSDHNLFDPPPYIANDCLLYYKVFPSDGLHNLTYDSNTNNVFLQRFDVVSVNGGSGTPVGSGSANPTPTSNGSGKGGSSSVGPNVPGSSGSFDKVAKAAGISISAIIGIIVALIALAVVGCIVACVVYRRRRRARPTVYGNPGAMPSMSQSYAVSTPADSRTDLAQTYPPPPAVSFSPPNGPPPSMFSQTPPVAAFSPPPGPPPSHTPVRVPSTASQSAYSSHGPQATTTQSRPRPSISTANAPSASSAYSPGASYMESPDDPYAGMASFHADPFAFSGRGVVLSAEGLHAYDTPSLPPKIRAERIAVPVNRVGESSGSSSAGALVPVVEDAPPPIYQETDALATRP